MSIRKRDSKKFKNGFVYEVRFTYDDHGVAKRYQKSGFISKKEAQDHENKMRHIIKESGGLRQETKKTLNEVFDEFLKVGSEKYQYNTVRNTMTDYRHVRDTLGKMPIASIDYPTLQKYFNSRKNKGIQSNKNIRKALSRVMKYAIKSGYITSNPVDLVDVVGVDNTRPTRTDVLTEEDAHDLVECLRDFNTFRYEAYAIAILLGVGCGLRVSEALALNKSDFDFDNDTFSINKKINYSTVKMDDITISGMLKSKSSYTDNQPIPLSLKKELMEWFEKNPFDVVCCTENGGYIHPNVMSLSVKRAVKKNNLPFEFHYHMLRHTYATILKKNGVDIKTCQELLRHSSISTTMDIYTHIDNEEKKEAVNKVFGGNWVEIGSKIKNGYLS